MTDNSQSNNPQSAIRNPQLPVQHHEMPDSPQTLIHDLWVQYQETALDFEQLVRESAQYHQRGDELQGQLERLLQRYEELQLRERAAAQAAHEARIEANALKIRLAYAEDLIAALNQGLTWCQNMSWEVMTKVAEYLQAPHHRLGRAWQIATRDKKATLKALATWGWRKLQLKPYSVAKALPTPYEVAEIRESLEILAFFARDAKRQISDLPVTTPTSMAAAAPPRAHCARPDLIVYSITSWDFRRQRPQHLVERLVARGSRAFVMPTDLPGLGEAFPSDEQILAKMGARPLGEEIWEITPCAFNDLNIYKNTLSDPRDLAILRRSLALLRERFGIGAHVGLVQLPFWGPLALELPGARVVYDCMDNHRDFSTNDPAMIAHEERLVAEAEAVVVSSAWLDRALGERPRAKALIRNGCEYDFFAAPPEALDARVAALKGPVIGYYGAISDWFDAGLVEAVARRRPEWNFVLIGHTFGAAIEGLQELPNVLFTGEVPYATLTSFLHRFDVCMIPFRLTELIQATNPVKIYEYSAAGKPTVATRIPEVEALGELAAIADDTAGFEAAIARLLAEPEPAARAERLRAFARENTWDARAEALDRVMQQHVWPRVSVVVLSFNNWPLTRDCLQSILHETTWPNFELIVVDNASSDETREELQKLSDPRLKLQLNNANLGYAGGNNSGARLAGGDVIVLLNNDTICPPDWLERLLAPLAEDPHAGMAGPMTSSAGNEQMLDLFCQSHQDQREWLEEFQRVRRGRRHATDRLGFFCVAIRREVWRQVGELDAAFEVGFFEDDDYCARVAAAGWKLVVAEDAFVYHHGSASFNKLEQSERQAIEEKNRARFEAKHGRSWRQPIGEADYFGIGGPGDEARPVAVIGPAIDWNVPIARPQQLALALVRAGWRVYYLTDNQRRDHIQGIRLLSPFLHLVENRGQYLEEVAQAPVELLVTLGPRSRSSVARFAGARVVVDLAGPCEWAWQPGDPHLATLVAERGQLTAAHPALLEALPEALRKKAKLMPGGVEVAHFALRAPLAPPKAIAGLVHPGAAPVVAVLASPSDAADWAWLEELARQRRDWAFAVIDASDGAVAGGGALPDFFNLRNVHHLKGQAYVDWPALLAFVHGGIVPPYLEAVETQGREAALVFLAAGVPLAAAPELEGLEGMAGEGGKEGVGTGLREPQAAGEALAASFGLRNDAAFRERAAALAARFDWQLTIAALKNQED